MALLVSSPLDAVTAGAIAPERAPDAAAGVPVADVRLPGAAAAAPGSSGSPWKVSTGDPLTTVRELPAGTVGGRKTLIPVGKREAAVGSEPGVALGRAAEIAFGTQLVKGLGSDSGTALVREAGRVVGNEPGNALGRESDVGFIGDSLGSDAVVAVSSAFGVAFGSDSSSASDVELGVDLGSESGGETRIALVDSELGREPGSAFVGIKHDNAFGGEAGIAFDVIKPGDAFGREPGVASAGAPGVAQGASGVCASMAATKSPGDADCPTGVVAGEPDRKVCGSVATVCALTFTLETCAHGCPKFLRGFLDRLCEGS